MLKQFNCILYNYFMEFSRIRSLFDFLSVQSAIILKLKPLRAQIVARSTIKLQPLFKLKKIGNYPRHSLQRHCLYRFLTHFSYLVVLLSS